MVSDEEPQNDPAQPNLVWAKAPAEESGWLLLLTHPATIRTWIEMGGLAKIGEYAGLIHGRFGDDGSGYVPPGTTGLLRPLQIHRGLRRPLFAIDQDIGPDVLIYVTDPPQTYAYRADGKFGGFPRAEPKPLQSVFTTFVSLDRQLVDATKASMQRAPLQPVDGVVLYWEWTVAHSGPGAASFLAGYEEQLQ